MFADLTEMEEEPLLDEHAPSLATTRRIVNALPSGLVFTEAAIAALRADLVAHGRGDWEIFQTDKEFWHIVQYTVGQDAPWRPLPALTGHEPMQKLDEYHLGRLWRTQSGVLALDKFAVVIGRWLMFDPTSGYNRSLRLIAAPSAAEIERLFGHVRDCLAKASQAIWQVVSGSTDDDDDTPPPRPSIDRGTLVLDESILQRIEHEAVGFFAEPVAQMYAKLRVPLRRGVLLYGPPGNGKTSTIRYLGGRLPHVAALVLRPGSEFTTDHLLAIMRKWKAQAPAMLVIEDLNWMLARIDVSQFLNVLDGIETPDTKGLLLVASTNHPDRLDPALSNRPGRFDVVIEVPLPDEALRRRYLERQLPDLNAATLELLIERSDGLSFAHLGEVIRAAGLAVIGAGRTERSDDDLLRAVEVVREANQNAERGFRGALPAFGLQARVRRT